MEIRTSQRPASTIQQLFDFWCKISQMKYLPFIRKPLRIIIIIIPLLLLYINTTKLPQSALGVWNRFQLYQKLQWTISSWLNGTVSQAMPFPVSITFPPLYYCLQNTNVQRKLAKTHFRHSLMSACTSPDARLVLQTHHASWKNNQNQENAFRCEVERKKCCGAPTVHGSSTNWHMLKM